jgi:hypothetical protein
MGYDLQSSMTNGVNKSTIFLACINETYQKSKNCCYELAAAATARKPIVVLSTQSDPFRWADNNIKSVCDMSNKKFVDIGAIASLWDNAIVTGADPSPALVALLAEGVGQLVGLLHELNCKPTV